MSAPFRLFVRCNRSAPTILASAWAFARRLPTIDTWAQLIQPGAAETVAVRALILSERLPFFLTVGAVVTGHD